MTEKPKDPTPAGSPAAAGSGTVKFTYRVAAVLLKIGLEISFGYQIEARRSGARMWLPVNIGGTPLRYFSRRTADRHCKWLNDPSGTEPEWGHDESPNASPSATPNPEESRER